MSVNKLLYDKNQKIDLSRMLMSFTILLQIFSLIFYFYDSYICHSPIYSYHAVQLYFWIDTILIIIFAILFIFYIEKNTNLLIFASGLLFIEKVIVNIRNMISMFDSSYLPDFFEKLASFLPVLFFAFLTLLFAKKIKNSTLPFITLAILFSPFMLFMFIRSQNSYFWDATTALILISELSFYLSLMIFLGKKLNIEAAQKSFENQPQNISKLIILSIITLGIYTMFWAFRTIRIIKGINNSKNKNYTGELICYIFVPFYFLYWIYTRTQDVYKYATKKGINISNNSVINLVISLLGFGIIAIALLQRGLNTLPVELEDQDLNQDIKSPQIKQNSNTFNKLRELAQLKEEGILTEEEFLCKKQELLNRI